MKLMKDKLKDLPKAHPQGVEDITRVLCMILFGSLLFATTDNILYWGNAKFIEDLECIRDYNLCDVIMWTLIQSMVTKTEQPSRVNGRNVFLLYWLCEHTTKFTLAAIGNIPRCAKWNLQTIADEVTRHTLDGLKDEEGCLCNIYLLLHEEDFTV